MADEGCVNLSFVRWVEASDDPRRISTDDRVRWDVLDKYVSMVPLQNVRVYLRIDAGMDSDILL